MTKYEYGLAVDGASGEVIRTRMSTRPDSAEIIMKAGGASSAYDEVTCPDCGKVGVAHTTVGERCPAAVTKAKPRTCPNCGMSNPPASEDPANANDLCYHCGSRLDGEEPLEKRQTEQIKYLGAMARSGDSEVARRGMEALTRQVGPVAAADIVNRR